MDLQVFHVAKTLEAAQIVLKALYLSGSVEPVMGSFCNEATGLCEPRTSVDVPTLSEWGLVAMAGILGIVGYLVIRRRKVTA